MMACRSRDGVVSDLNMPGVDSYQPADALRDRAGLLVAVSGRADEPRARAADPSVIHGLVQSLGQG
jgi:CheY-like chemotaxis protein